jgi:hypothetical protein
MKKYIPYILLGCLTVAFSFFATEKTFAQTNQTENKMDSTKSVSAKPNATSPYVTGLTAGRVKSLLGVVAGVISLIFGWRAKERSTANIGSGSSRAITALVLGLVAITLSVVHLATTTGGFGTGGGKAGGIVGLVLGLIGATRGGLALRSKKNKMKHRYDSQQI